MKIQNAWISLILITVIVSGVINAQSNSPEKNNDYKYIDSDKTIRRMSSLIAIIANPERFHNKEVYLIGFVTFDIEGTRAAVFNSTESAKHQVTPDSVFVDYSGCKNKPEFLTKANGEWCILSGVIDANKGGPPEMEYHSCVLKLVRATIGVK